MNLWLVRYKTESGAVKVARVLAGRRLDAWVICVRHEFAHTHDMPVELLEIRMDGKANAAKGVAIFEVIRTEVSQAEVRS